MGASAAIFLNIVSSAVDFPIDVLLLSWFLGYASMPGPRKQGTR